MEDNGILLLITIAASFGAGYVYRELELLKELDLFKAALKNQLDGVNNGLKDAGVSTVKKITHEIVGSVNYFYDEDGAFTGQGTTLEDAAVHFTLLQGPGNLGIFKHTSTGKDYYFVNNTCMELNREFQ